MNAVVTFIISAAALLVTTVVGDLVSEEVRGHLERIPYALVRLAARRLPVEVRSEYVDEWQAELDYVLARSSGLPITRLLRGAAYALGLVRATGHIRRTERERSRSFSVEARIGPITIKIGSTKYSPGALVFPGSWTEFAACSAEGVDADADDFFAHRGGQEHLAKRVCDGCPVRSECLNYALSSRMEYGIWGGTTPSERAEILRNT